MAIMEITVVPMGVGTSVSKYVAVAIRALGEYTPGRL